MQDLFIILGFWVMVFAPCIVAFRTGLHSEPKNTTD